MKANYKKSRARIIKKNPGYALLIDQKEIDEAKIENEAKQKALAEKMAKKGGKGGGSKGKAVSKGAARLPATPIASRSKSGGQTSNLEGQFTSYRT